MGDDLVVMDAQIEWDGELVCPSCKSTIGLHQQRVKVQFREFEDGDGTTNLIGRGTALTYRSDAAEIPGRRDYIEIEFLCEQCSIWPDQAPESGTPGLLFVLCIKQHKGCTLIHWELRKQEPRGTLRVLNGGKA